MGHSGAPTVVTAQQPVAAKPKKPIVGEVRQFESQTGEPAFFVKFKKNGIEITVDPEVQPDITRTIVPKYGNVRKIEGQMHQVADLALWHLFNITEDN